MANHKVETIPLENLLINLFNPRYGDQHSQRDAIATLAHEQEIKLVNLAEDIADKGLNPTDLPLVTEAGELGFYVVLEGNRRIAALKLASSPQLVDSIGLQPKLVKRYKSLYESMRESLPNNILCTILSPEDAKHWILIKHTGANQGVGVVNWSGTATQRFRGNSPELQAIELVEGSPYLDEETRQKLPNIAITTVGRFLATPEARRAIGVDVEKGHLLFLGDKNEAIARLALVVSDVANRRVRVSDLDFKNQRIEYANEIATRTLPLPNNNGKRGGQSSSSRSGSGGRNRNPIRNTLIPKNFKLTIEHTRINTIYDELRKLDVERFANSCAVMLRVFLELSIDHYAQQNNISLKIIQMPSGGAKANPPPGALKSREMRLREKIKEIIDHFEKNKICTEDELHGIKALHKNKEHVLSVDSLNAYVHNMNYVPAPSDLKANWDSIQVFVEHLWT